MKEELPAWKARRGAGSRDEARVEGTAFSRMGWRPCWVCCRECLPKQGCFLRAPSAELVRVASKASDQGEHGPSGGQR